MALRMPDSMDECVYFTRREFITGKGKVICWVRRLACPKCKKGRMSKPLDEKTGKFKVRALEYACPSCGYTEEKRAHEEKLSAEITYECPFCKAKGETTVGFTRKSFYGKKAIVFACSACKEKLGVTKKMSLPPLFAAKLEGKSVKETEAAADLDEDDEF